MVAKKALSTTELPKPKLNVKRDEAREKIEKRIDLGRELEEKPIASNTDLSKAKESRRIWHDYNKELLGTIFSNEKIAREYQSSSHGAVFMVGSRSFYQEVDDYRESVQYKLAALTSILERLELFDQPTDLEVAALPIRTPLEGSEKNIFIVHGHDETLKEKVARLVSDLGLKPVILHEQPNKGETVIEKLESNASRSTFAIILLTPDDFGYSSVDGPNKVSSRARQNVILELGYFIGKLGRSRTCAIYRDMEIPSDFNGVVYVPYDDGAWRYNVAKELKAAGYSIDMNNL